MWSYLGDRLGAPSAIIWDFCFSLFSRGVLTGEPPQPGYRCVSEPLISIEGWRLGNDHRQLCLMLQLCRRRIWSNSWISLERRGWGGACWSLSNYLVPSKQSHYQDWKREFYILWSFFRIILQSHLKYRAGGGFSGWDGGGQGFFGGDGQMGWCVAGWRRDSGKGSPHRLSDKRYKFNSYLFFSRRLARERKGRDACWHVQKTLWCKHKSAGRSLD